MKMIETDLPGCLIFEPHVFGDDRGFFYESFNADKLAPLGLEMQWKQGNVSSSRGGVLRGLHYQWPKSQGKFVSVLEGEVWDVAVDIRRGSPTFGKWSAAVLSETNHHQLFIPGGFAHGFCVLSETAEIMYKCSEFYDPRDDRGVRWNDPSFGIGWPVAEPVLSAKDAVLPFLRDLSEEQLPKHGHEKNKGD